MDPETFQRIRFQHATPFARAIGLRLTAWGVGFAHTTLPPSGPTRLDDAGEAGVSPQPIHPLALIGMADHAISYAFTAAIPPRAGMSTLDLRLDFAAAAFNPDLTGAIHAQARVHHIAAQNGMASLSATDDAGRHVLAASALFNFRTFPGGGGAPKSAPLTRFKNDHAGPFEPFLALTRAPDGVTLAGNTRRTVGFEGLPALHGGVLGAALAAACAQEALKLALPMRLATLQIRYLRPGGMAPLQARAVCARAGRSAAFFDAACWHTEGENVAAAQATFVPMEG